MDKQLKTIAQAARREMKDFARKNPGIGDPCDLACFCALASYFFKIVAERFDYDVILVEGVAFDFFDFKNSLSDNINHCWTEYNGKIYDLTATQFGSSRTVHIVNKTNKNYYAINAGIKVDDHNLSESFREWPSEQAPILFKRELQKRAEKVVSRLRAARFA